VRWSPKHIATHIVLHIHIATPAGFSGFTYGTLVHAQYGDGKLILVSTLFIL